MKRVWHPIHNWEELESGMWDEVSNKSELLEKAIEFTGDHELYGSYMHRVINEWQISCENALTDSLLNRRAWIGHAACALALRCPEDITRKAWGHLTDEQRVLANRQADRAIKEWEYNYGKCDTLFEDLDGSLL